MAATMREAVAAYNRRLRWLGRPGTTRWAHRTGWFALPRWADDIETLAVHAGRRARGRCLSCRQPDRGRAWHKMDCPGGYQLRDNLRRLRLWRRRDA